MNEYYNNLIELINEYNEDDDHIYCDIIEELNTLSYDDVVNFIKYLISIENIKILTILINVIDNLYIELDEINNFSNKNKNIDKIINEYKKIINKKKKKNIK